MASYLKIWQNDEINPLDSAFKQQKLLTLTMFVLSPMMDEEERHKQLIGVYDTLMKLLSPWIDHYVWDFEPISPKIYTHDGYEYVFANLQLGELISDEWLITWLLYNVSLQYEDVFVQVYDYEGEFVLIESWESLPSWVSPEVATNRVWLNKGRFIIIPDVYYMDRSLKLVEALTFLTRASYKCLINVEMNAIIGEKLKEYPYKALESQLSVDFQLEADLIGSLIDNSNQLNHVIWDKVKDVSIMNDGLEEEYPIGETVLVNARMRVETFLLLKTTLERFDKDDVVKDGGKFISIALREYFEREDISLRALDQDELAAFNEQNSKDLLQVELQRNGVIEKFTSPLLEFDNIEDVNEEGTHNEKIMMEKLESFFKDTEANIDGVVNKSEEEDTESDTDDDEKTRDFLTKANVDIDEDDFFEFFAKEALKMSDEDLDQLRNLTINDDSEQEEDDGDDNDNEDEFNFDDTPLSHEELQESLRDFLKSLKENPMDGPASTFLENLK